ncbi:MAG: UDP-N-acetylenolpyruvoylglucosamine reductase, partial [Microgenomates group bacterium GW2011_GWC1_44_10]
MGPERVKLDEPLSSHTTLKIGGPADLFYEAKNSGELIKAVRLARSFEVPVTVIAGGSNVLVGDLGIRGLTVANRGGKIEIREKKFLGFRKNKVIEVDSRWMVSNKGTMKYDFSDLDYDESDFPEVEVSIGSGVNLQLAMDKLFDEGITGLQWYARIPGSLGGAVFNNIHGGNHVFFEIVKDVVVLTQHGDVMKIPVKSMRFEYDKSRLQTSGEIV